MSIDPKKVLGFEIFAGETLNAVITFIRAHVSIRTRSFSFRPFDATTLTSAVAKTVIESQELAC